MCFIYSPSDLEADLEDNQDYDSTVSHSETNLTLIGRSESSDAQVSGGFLSRQQGSHYSKFSPESSRASSAAALKFGVGITQQQLASDQDSNNKNLSPVKSSVSSLVSRYSRDPESQVTRESEHPAKDYDGMRPSTLAGLRDTSYSRIEKPAFSSYMASRLPERDNNGSGTCVNSSVVSVGSSNIRSTTSRFALHTPRPFITQNSNNSGSSSNSEATTAQLEKVRHFTLA